MLKKSSSESGAFNPRIFLVFALCAVGALLAMVSFGASPSSTTVTPASAPITWVGTSPGGAATDETSCVEGVTCDTFTITLSGTKADWLNKQAHVAISWDDPIGGVIDYDMYIHKGTPAGPVVGQSAGGDNPEQTNINPNDGAVDVGTGIFIVRIVYFTANSASQCSGRVTVIDAPPPPQRSAAARYPAASRTGGASLLQLFAGPRPGRKRR